MDLEIETGKRLLMRHHDLIEQIVRSLAARKRLSLDERQDLLGQVMLKIVRDDYALLRRFRGRSSWKTYLTVVVHRVWLDDRTREWGRWRPCARARKLGPTAVLLDRRINRDGVPPREAVGELLARAAAETEGELEALAAQVPRRPRRRLVDCETSLEQAAGRENADGGIEMAERRRAARRVRAALELALRELPEDERRMLRLRYAHGWTVRRIAASQGLEARPLYRRFECILRRLRRHLAAIGLRSWAEVGLALRAFDIELDVELLRS